MNDFDIIVIGSGPAGVSACCEFAKAGFKVALVEQFSDIGGAVFRHASKNQHCSLVPKSINKLWQRLFVSLEQYKLNITQLMNTKFVGVDSSGVVMLENRLDQLIRCHRPRAIVIATGAIEEVEIFNHWDNPNIITIGALQVSLKACDKTPKGDIVLAGNGPLLLAMASQLIRSGNKPKAIIETGQPLRNISSAIKLPFNYLYEGGYYLYQLKVNRIPIYYSSMIKSVEEIDNKLEITITDKDNHQIAISANVLALHNGLAPNNIGLPKENDEPTKLYIRYAGDCNKIIGSLGAQLDGQSIAQELINTLNDAESNSKKINVQKHLNAQYLLSEIYRPRVQLNMLDLPDQTIVCRCEQKTIGDLKKLCSREKITAKEIKLNGRFTMGRCQGRFCQSTVTKVMNEYNIAPINQVFSTNQRWPIKPTSIKTLANLQHKQRKL